MSSKLLRDVSFDHMEIEIALVTKRIQILPAETSDQKWIRQLPELDPDSNSDVPGSVSVQLDQSRAPGQVPRGEAPFRRDGSLRVSRSSRPGQSAVER